MLIKVKDSTLEEYGKEFKVRRMNFNEIIVNYPMEMGLKNFLFDSVDLISENKIDEFLIENRQFLKIKLKRGISVHFYEALKYLLEIEIKDKVKDLNVLKDKYKANKNGIWEKYILLVVNKIFPIEVISSGKNFKKDSYNITINKLEKENFLEVCHEEINNINGEIEIRKLALSMLDEAINDIQKDD